MPELPPHELYATKLRRLNLGYALFEPDPNGVYDRVRVGDVGYITDDGKFIKLFNAFYAEGSPENDRAKFPANFEPIAERYREVDNLGSLLSGPRLSESVRVVDIGGNLSVLGPIPPPVAGASIGLSCTTRSGAALITKYIATRQKALSSKAMEDYMIKNGLSWLQIARDLGRPVEMHDLIFVRERILTGDWATITWDKSTCDSQISFNIGVDGIANAALSYWGQWEDRISVPKRQGPLRSGSTYEDDSSTNFDQCIFLKGLRIVLREWYERIAHFLKIRATDAGEFDEEMSRISTVRLLKRYGFKLETIGEPKSSFRPVQNAYDIVAIFILEETNADIAIIDDNDIVSLQIDAAGTLEEVCDVLLELQIAPVVVFTTHDGGPCKVGKICWDEPKPPISSMTQKLSDGLIILDENYEPVHSKTESSHLTSTAVSSSLDISSDSLGPTQSFKEPITLNTTVLHPPSDPDHFQLPFDLGLSQYSSSKPSGKVRDLLRRTALAARLRLKGQPDRSKSLWMKDLEEANTLQIWDTHSIASGSSDNTIRTWDTQSGTLVGEPLQGHGDMIYPIAFPPRGSKIASGSSDKTVRIRDIQSVGEPFQGHSGIIDSVAFSSDGKRIASGSSDKTIRIWDAQSGTQVGEPLEGHSSPVCSVTFSPDGSRIASGSIDKTIRIWDSKSGAQVGEPLKGHSDWVNSVAFSPDGSRIVSGSSDKTIRIWDSQSGTQVGKPLEGHSGAIWSIAFSPDGSRIASGSYDKTIGIWDAKSGTQIGESLRGHSGPVLSVAFSPDGSRIASGSSDLTIRIWDAQSSTQVGEPLQGHSGVIWSVAFSPDGSRIASGSSGQTIRIWDPESGTQIGESLRGHSGPVLSVAFSPDGSRIVSGSSDDTVRIWDAQSGTQVGEPLKGHSDWANSVAFSPDGSRIAPGSGDRTIRIWDSQSGTQVGEPLQGHNDVITSVTFSPDGSRMVSRSDDETIQLWNARSDTSVGAPLKRLW